MRWIAAHTWLLLLIPLVSGILLCYYTGFPKDLFHKTEVDYIDCDTVLALHIVSEGQERAKTIRYTAEAADKSRILLYLQKDSLPYPDMGDILLVKTMVQRGDTLGNFDYGRYLRLQGIVGSAWAHRGNWQIIGHSPLKGLCATAERCQRWLYQRYKQMGIHEPELGILSALTLGYREELDKQVQQSFSAAGAMHILAVSGLHTGIVWGIIVWILTLGGYARPLYHQRGRRTLLVSTTLIALWSYAFLTGLSPSVMRSALMVTLLSIGGILERNMQGLNYLAAAAVIILLINPLALWSVSFQLSFAAMAAIILVAQRMQQRIVLRGKVKQYIGSLLIMSIAAQIGTLPLTLHYFGQTSNFFALTNIVVIPAAFVLLLLGIAALTFSWCIVGTWLASIAQLTTHWLRLFVEWIEHLPYSTTHIHLSTTSVILCYLAIAFSLLMMRGDKTHWWWLIGVVASAIAIIIIEIPILKIL
ncbi:MAG: ComEC/Rec2 family competence protein [Paludibacteraceae bacterium]|nr:ComEC/Rec2 family competence protein [Paludibacteraceae bacterium]